MQLIGALLAAAGFASVASAAAAGPYGWHAAPTAPTCKAYTTVVSTTITKTSVQVNTVTSVRVVDVPVTVPTTIVKTLTIVDTTTSTVTTTAVHNATVILTTTATVTPTPTKFCLSTAAATNLVNGFALLLTDYTTANAEALLAADFTDTSDSINFLAGNPLGSTTFGSKAAFEAGQGSEPAIGFTVDGIDAIGCSSIGYRWTANLGSPDLVKGINIIIASNTDGTDDGWQIETNYSEFNSAVWDIDIGGSCSPHKLSDDYGEV